MEEFVKVLGKLVILFRQMIPIEETKLEAAKGDQITVIEECMVKEQAAVLQLRGLEKERERLQEELGYAGCTFREILSQAPESDVELLRPVFEELSTQISVFQEISDGAARIIRTNLHMLESARDIKDGATYNGSGATKEEQHFTSRRI